MRATARARRTLTLRLGALLLRLPLLLAPGFGVVARKIWAYVLYGALWPGGG